ncbi:MULTISPECIES: SIR2 family NAD-dependent protein deacylase [Flavobacterium]|uniref:NAD-dependent protein deacylase n=2 Tax=Flavobacterium TaxID=237 RepID=A0AA94JPK7_9FLAO|nr:MULTISPECIES: NAD-dependent deacylase [Flavobacterium]OXA75839.1 NAD-dependent deacylase [Flavobacterium columnare] [Flavobacterium columnare NBRC 100251 = ATCC 23463]AMA48717.1 NAD-dependent deacylase [Flavobacterium covae]AND65147.1 NAD-dependent protein deacylase [Flavobacterium covae]MCH4830671.1 NAD-dependent deacylase [Flavobacterium columnare]MCH4833392.1 NAD-dependent deacylase [Flavobacterium columnare]
MKKKLVILTGAGMSAESGISTFRDSNGLWENHDIMEVASPDGWQKNPALVLDFYNQRRAQLKRVHPNRGHEIIAELEKNFDVHIITQNVDNLHERAGSSKVLHLHGELTKARSTKNNTYIIDWTEDLHIGDTAPDGSQLRPHIVWFGEAVPGINQAIPILEKADILIIIGTSLKVYPAAGLMHYVSKQTPIYYIDPKPAHVKNSRNLIETIPLNASEGIQSLIERGI